MQREFFDWSKPCLAEAARWIVDRFCCDKRLDLREVVLVFPGQRAVLRLEELLLDEVDRRVQVGTLLPDWFPPRTTTFGGLSELLYKSKRSFASELLLQYCWLAVFDDCEKNNPELLIDALYPWKIKGGKSIQTTDHSTLLPKDNIARLTLVEQLVKLHEELADELHDFNDVYELLRKTGTAPELIRQWKALAELQKRQLALLDSIGYWDKQSARLFAIRHQETAQEIRTDKTIVLIGTTDMSQSQKTILRLVGDKIIGLVFAPADENPENLFDELGCLIPEKWESRPVDINDDQLEMVDNPEADADAIINWLAQWNGQLSPNRLTVGLPSGNEALLPFLEQQLQYHSIESNIDSKHHITATQAYLFLKEWSEFLAAGSFASLANLVRLPGVELFCQELSGILDSPDIITELDKFHKEKLPAEAKSATGSFSELMEALDCQNVTNESGRSLDCTKVLEVAKIFVATSSVDQAVLDILEKVNRQLKSIPESITPELSVSERINLLLSLASREKLSGNNDVTGGIQISSWLELPMDDSSAMILTGLNEGMIPVAEGSSPFLSNAIRRQLMPGHHLRRSARDNYILSLLLAARSIPGTFRMTVLRRSSEGDPILPSRLLFTNPDTDLVVTRTLKVLGLDKETVSPASPVSSASPASASPAKEVAGKSKFCAPTLPAIYPDDSQWASHKEVMSVTDFRKYLSCPYRYYLERQLKLTIQADSDEELDSLGFGSLAHQTLQDFGNSKVAKSTDSSVIKDWLYEKLKSQIIEQFGATPRAVIAIQAEQLNIRLAAFALWQAQWAQAGNEICFVESKPNKDLSWLEVNGRKTYLTGRIDRIDYNPNTGIWYLFDYKTSGTASSPEKSHRKSGEWVDLQLPLYRQLIRSLDTTKYGSPIDDQNLRLGYINLPKSLNHIGAAIANLTDEERLNAEKANLLTQGLHGKDQKNGHTYKPWTEEDFNSADETAKDVIRGIRKMLRFGSKGIEPVSPPPAFSELFAPICLDNQIKQG